jgi:gluconokinase
MPAPSRFASPAVLAIDIGTSSVRTALFDAHARIIPRSQASQAYRLRHTLDHAATLDPQVLLRSTKRCLRQTKSRLTRSDRPVLTGSGFWHSLLGLDRNADPLTPIYTWADARSAPDAAQLREQLDERTIQQRTGCMLRASFWPAKLAWLRRTEPALFRRVARWVSPAEWVFEKICGVRGCSHSMASGTGLYHLTRRDWDDEMLERFGLKRKNLGSLGEKSEFGAGIVFPPIGDGAAGNLGSGAISPGLVAVNVGTSAALRAVAPEDAALPFGLFRFRIDEKRSLLGGAISNAGNLRSWCLRELRLPDDKRKIEKLFRQKAQENAGLTILPFWMSERAPTWPDQIEGTITGLTQAATAGDILFAAVAASFHRLADVLSELERAVGRARRIIVSGGIVQSAASLQLLADSLGRDLEVCAEQEASLRGAAVHALEELGCDVPPPKMKKRVPHDPAQHEVMSAQGSGQRKLEQILQTSFR